MFLRKHTRTKNGKKHSYYALVESVRTASGPRQQVVSYLGELNHDQERRWQRTVVFYNCQGEARQLRLFPDDEDLPLPDDPDVVRVRLGSVSWTNGRTFGDIWLAHWLWEQLHLDEIMARHLPQGRHTVGPAEIVAKERAIRRRQLLGLHRALRKLRARVEQGRLKKRDKILECVGRLQGRYPKANALVTITVTKEPLLQLSWSWRTDKLKNALAQDGAYLLQSNQPGWSAADFWETYMQLTVVEKACRVLKSELLLRPVWHHYDDRVQAHVFICVLAYALWKTLDHLAKRAGLQTLIHKPDEERRRGIPKPRPITPETILRELRQIQIGDILPETTDGRRLALRRVARPNQEQARILSALGLKLPERLSPDRLL